MATQILLLVLSLYLILCSSEVRISCNYKGLNPIINTCSISSGVPIDTVILNDISCPITEPQCRSQQQMIAESIKSIKSESESTSIYYNTNPQSRVAYIEFNATDIYQLVSLIDGNYNVNPVTESDIKSFYNQVQNSGDCINVNSRTAVPALDAALDMVWNEFDIANPYKSSEYRLKHILIFSNCKASSYMFQDICANAAEFRIDDDVNIVMVNNGQNFVDDDSYLSCLVKHDSDKIINNVAFSYPKWSTDIRDNVQELICNYSFTTTTTMPPTTTPCNKKKQTTTKKPWEKRKTTRRLLGNIKQTKRPRPVKNDTSNQTNVPCITMSIYLETENLLPLNIRPDPASNLGVIGKAMGDTTNGTITVPTQPDFEDGDDINDYPGYENWTLDPGCYIDNQRTEKYLQKGDWNAFGLHLVITETTDGFIATTSFTTDTSIAYIFKLSEMPLDIFHECKASLNMSAAIYLNNELMERGKTYELVQPSVSTPTIFTFAETLQLLPETTYEIRFELEDGYPFGCNFDDITIGSSNNKRRLLTQTLTINGQKCPSSCAVSGKLAQSEKMRNSVQAMCELDITARANIEEGLFRQHSAMSTVRDHIFKTGSLYLYDSTTGDEVGYTDEFPKNSIQNPCIAVDNDNGILYAIGGHTSSGAASDVISAYQLSTSLTGSTIGELIDYGVDWNLDKPRYAASCIYWKNDYRPSLVVIGGMNHKSEEFTSRTGWYKDIRIYPIPRKDENGNYVVSESEPTSGAVEMDRKLTDFTPIIKNDHMLHLYGGKTHKASKTFTQTFNLDTIYSRYPSMIVTEKMLLGEAKALPLADAVSATIDDIVCNGEMAFSGQSYADYEPVEGEDGLNTNLVTLFCSNVIEFRNGRRRMAEFDTQMSEKYDVGNRRDLGTVTEEETQIKIVEYNFYSDGWWYDYTVKLELCYEDNDELKQAVDYYNNVIDSIAYKNELSEKILNISLEAYFGWSDGFGAVNVIDLDILDIRYEDEPCDKNKTKGPVKTKLIL